MEVYLIAILAGLIWLALWRTGLGLKIRQKTGGVYWFLVGIVYGLYAFHVYTTGVASSIIFVVVMGLILTFSIIKSKS